MPIEAVTVIMCKKDKPYIKKSGLILGTIKRYNSAGCYLMKSDERYIPRYYSDSYSYTPQLDDNEMYRVRVDILRVYHNEDNPGVRFWLLSQCRLKELGF